MSAVCLSFRRAALAATVFSCLGHLAAAEPSCTIDRAIGTTIDPKPFIEGGYGVRWSAAADRLAFMQPNQAGYYRVWTMKPDGTDRRPVTDGVSGLPTGHQGTPYWHPSGRYFIFTAQKAEWHGHTLFGVPDYQAIPGFGRHDDLWMMSADGSRTWRLTSDTNTKEQGVLIPVFSPDGKHIAWSARQPGKKYKLQVADFVETPAPHIENIRSFQPGGPAYYETGAFSSDGLSLIYTSDQDTRSFWRSQIYRLDLATGTGKRLTTGYDYNEHPTVASSPAGDWIIYMSTRGATRFPMRAMLGADWYAMRIDGSRTKRLTTMNVSRTDSPESIGKPQVAGTVAMSPTGDYMLGDVQDSLIKQTGLVRIVKLRCH